MGQSRAQVSRKPQKVPQLADEVSLIGLAGSVSLSSSSVFTAATATPAAFPSGCMCRRSVRVSDADAALSLPTGINLPVLIFPEWCWQALSSFHTDVLSSSPQSTHFLPAPLNSMLRPDKLGKQLLTLK